MSSLDLEPTLRQLVEKSGWICIKAGNRSGSIEKDGVILNYSWDYNGEYRSFDVGSLALARSDTGLTIVPDFKQMFAAMKLSFRDSNEDFVTIDENLDSVRGYLADKQRLLERFRERVKLMREATIDGAGMARRLPHSLRGGDFLQQMTRVDESYRQAAQDQLPKYEQAIESLSRSSK